MAVIFSWLVAVMTVMSLHETLALPPHTCCHIPTIKHQPIIPILLHCDEIDNYSV